MSLVLLKSEKTCIKCGLSKGASAFPRDRRNADGLMGTCKACENDRNKTWQSHNPEKVRGFRRARYGIDFNALWEQQQGLCALCGDPMLPRGKSAKSVVVDHDHNCCPGRLGTSCGKCVRGLIHSQCNRALGIVEKNPELIKRVGNYLTNYRARLA